jgi:4-hydroxyphenylpyruvate dioxygenase
MPLPYKIYGFDHIFFIVANAKQAAYYYQTLFGFEPFAYRGLETGAKDEVSYALKQNDIIFVFTSPLTSQSDLNNHIRLHGDGVKGIALLVDDAGEAYDYAIDRGAISIQEPVLIPDDFGVVTIATIQIYGDTVQTFVERHKYDGIFMPGYEPHRSHLKIQPVGLHMIDHIVANQSENQMEKVVQWYEKKLGFHRFWSADNNNISTEYTAFQSVAVTDENEKVKFSINQPAKCMRISQIEEFLKFYSGPGVLRIAMHSEDIIKSVKQLTANGVTFIQVPSNYYQGLQNRVGDINEDIEELARLGILVDRDDSGYLLQIFTKPVQDRPTLYLEIIQRRGATSFGKGNYKALLEAIEHEQEKRKTI